MMILELVAFAILFLFLITNQTWLRIRKPQLPPSPRALPIIGHLHLLGPLIHHSFRELSSYYGPLIYLRLGSVPCVVASTPQLAKQLLQTHELTFSSRKHNAAIDRLTYNSAFAFAPYGPYWKFIKRLSTTQLLGSRTLSQFLPIRTKEFHHFVRLLFDKAEAGETVNVTQELLKLTNNIISQMMFSIRCSTGMGSWAEEARVLIREVTQIFGEFNVSDFIWFCKKLDLQGCRKRFEDIHRRYDALLEKIITDREQVREKKKKDGGGDDVKDFLDLILDALEDNNSDFKLTRKHIKALVLDFLTAATDTTAIGIEWSLAELINNPMVLEKAQKEIEKVVGKNRLVEESDAPNLPYIQAIIKETLRLHPPIPMVSRKSTQDCKINGYIIPAETLLFVNIWSIGRDPEYWENPMEFEPERFLQTNHELGDGTGLIDVKGQHFELLPFGSGRRGCPGISLAMQELPTMVAAMVQCFDWRVVSPSSGLETNMVDMTEKPGLTAPRADDLVCVPMARFSSSNIFHS